MIPLPQLLAALTSASKFAAPGGQPTWGDAFQGIGNSMANWNRYGTNDPKELLGIAQKRGQPDLPGMFGSNPAWAAAQGLPQMPMGTPPIAPQQGQPPEGPGGIGALLGGAAMGGGQGIGGMGLGALLGGGGGGGLPLPMLFQLLQRIGQ